MLTYSFSFLALFISRSSLRYHVLRVAPSIETYECLVTRPNLPNSRSASLHCIPYAGVRNRRRAGLHSISDSREEAAATEAAVWWRRQWKELEPAAGGSPSGTSTWGTAEDYEPSLLIWRTSRVLLLKISELNTQAILDKNPPFGSAGTSSLVSDAFPPTLPLTRTSPHPFILPHTHTHTSILAHNPFAPLCSDLFRVPEIDSSSIFS